MKNQIGRSKKRYERALANHKKVMLGNNFSSKKVINTKTNEIFVSVRKTAKENNINLSTLTAKLKGRLINNTDFKYYEN